MGTSYRQEPGRGGGLAGSGLLCFAGFKERRRGSNGGSAHLAEEGMAVGGRARGGVRWLKMVAVLGRETTAWLSAGGRRRGSGRVGPNDRVGRSAVGLGRLAGQG
jgi:hypothetical protein